MSEPTTEAGKRLHLRLMTLDKPHEWSAPAILAIEEEATTAEHERAVDACARMVIEARADLAARIVAAVEPVFGEGYIYRPARELRRLVLNAIREASDDQPRLP